MHINNCKNNCEYATEGILLSTAGTQKYWLYRCSKLNDRLITSDTVLLEVGCATYLFNPTKAPNVTIELMNRQLDEIAKMIPVDEHEPGPAHEPEPEVGISDTPVVVKPELKYEPIPEKVMEGSPTVNPVEKPVEPSGEKPIVSPKRRGRKPKTAEVPVSPGSNVIIPASVPVMTEPVTGDELKGV